jgi:hypothetical protein
MLFMQYKILKVIEMLLWGLSISSPKFAICLEWRTTKMAAEMVSQWKQGVHLLHVLCIFHLFQTAVYASRFPFKFVYCCFIIHYKFCSLKLAVHLIFLLPLLLKVWFSRKGYTCVTRQFVALCIYYIWRKIVSRTDVLSAIVLWLYSGTERTNAQHHVSFATPGQMTLFSPFSSGGQSSRHRLLTLQCRLDAAPGRALLPTVPGPPKTNGVSRCTSTQPNYCIIIFINASFCTEIKYMYGIFRPSRTIFSV